jgi:hypothetical protein
VRADTLTGVVRDRLPSSPPRERGVA